MIRVFIFIWLVCKIWGWFGRCPVCTISVVVVVLCLLFGAFAELHLVVDDAVRVLRVSGWMLVFLCGLLNFLGQ